MGLGLRFGGVVVVGCCGDAGWGCGGVCNNNTQQL